jgi:beta-galactosidase
MRPTRHGSAPALIRAGSQPGRITVRAELPGLRPAEATVTSVPRREDRIAAAAQPIYDHEQVRVDLGEKGQLVQFGWTPWYGESHRDAALDLPAMGGFRVTLRAGSADGITRWLGEMNVKGFQGFVSGEGVCVIDPRGLILEFHGLPDGFYRLKTYHHAPSSNTNSMDPNRERLKTLRIHEIPVATQLQVSVADVVVPVTLTAGKQLPESGPGTGTLRFAVEGGSSVTVRITGDGEARGIWLNGFELRESR